jgi:glycosyltransferase involved in cell wall biosynthesis
VPISLTDIDRKGILAHVLQRDLDGYFDQVLSIHFPSDRSQLVKLSERHAVWEFSGRFSPALAAFPYLNMLLAEAQVIVTVARELRRNPAAVIKAQDPYVQGLNGFILSRLTGAPFVTLVVSNYDLSYRSAKLLAYPQLRFQWAHRALARFVFRRTDLVQAMSDDNREFAISYGADPARARTVRSGAAPDAIHCGPLSDRKNLKAELGLSDAQVVLFVGRLSPEKYPDDVVECAARVVRNRAGVVFLLAGDGPMGARLEQMIADLHLDRTVRILGFQSQRRVMDLCFTADVIVAPLSGISLIEAALSGSPIVAYDVEWHSELIRTGGT